MTVAPDALLVLTTCGSDAQAREIARALVERRLAACVNVVPLAASIYRWRGAIEEETETLLLIKTTRARYELLRATIRELHTYDVPEVLALSLAAGDADYLDWLAESVEPDAAD